MHECFERAAGVFICVVGVFRNLDVHGLLRAHMCESRNEKIKGLVVYINFRNVSICVWI